MKIIRALMLASVWIVVQPRAYAQDKQTALQQSVEELQKAIRDNKPERLNKRDTKPKEGLAEIKKSLARRQPTGGSEELGYQGDGTAAASAIVTTHLRAKSGVGFPAPAEVVLPPLPPGLVPSVSVTEQARWESRSTLPSRPPRCERNFTNRFERYPDFVDTTIVHQRIFLSIDLVPLDPIDVYGPNVQLVTYGGEDMDSENKRMAAYGVPCVPFRRRLTPAALYEDYGTAALKNFADDPAGSGKLHVWVGQKLYGGR
jgi:hypothetical protein